MQETLQASMMAAIRREKGVMSQGREPGNECTQIALVVSKVGVV